MPAKLDRIKDDALRDSLATAHVSLKSGNFPDVVHRSSDAYVEMLRRDPDLMKGPMGMRRILFYPRLGARLIQESDGSPAVIYDRETFSFSEAITYFEFAVDSLVREGV
ncbi:MAG: hypothetical protein E6I03_06260 [Chloroflexi bacterium]|nr:MAG: hypothetical protein E6I03_06260 [Chloroflexota bacterium]